jgi:hypothetical protein
MLIELQKLVTQKLMFLCNKTTTVLSESTVPKSMDTSLLHIHYIINKQINKNI